MTRGNCKATITSNYRTTRLTPPNPTTTSNAYVGEIDGMSIAKDGRVFYAGRAVCSQGQAQITNWATPNVAPRLRHAARVGSEHDRRGH